MAPKKVWRKSAVRAAGRAIQESKDDVPSSGRREADWQDGVCIDEGAGQLKVDMASLGMEDDDMDAWCSWFGAHLERAAVRTAVGASSMLTAKEVNFAENQLTSVGMSKLLDILMTYKIRVLILKLHHNRITSAGNLSMFLAACKGTLRELHLSHNELSTSAAGQIMLATAALRDGNGAAYYPQPVKGGVGSAPFWLRLEQNFIDHKLLADQLEPAFAELRRPGRLFCSINGRGCTPRCCMRYRDEPPALHVKFLANQRPRPLHENDEEALTLADIQQPFSGPRASKSVRAAASAQTAKGREQSTQTAIGAATPKAAPGEPTTGTGRVWRVKEAIASAEGESTAVEVPASVEAVNLHGLPRWRVKQNQAPKEATSLEDAIATEELQGEAPEHVECIGEDAALEKVQPYDSSTVSEGDTRSSGELAQEEVSSGELAQEGSCSLSSHSGLDSMHEALVTPCENLEENEVPGIMGISKLEKALPELPSTLPSLDGQLIEKILPEPPPKSPTLEIAEKVLPQPPSRPPMLGAELEEKTLPEPPSQPPELEMLLPDLPTHPAALDCLLAERTTSDPPGELWKSILCDDENPSRKGKPTVGSSFNTTPSEFIPCQKIPVSMKASTTAHSFTLNPEAPEFIPSRLTANNASTASRTAPSSLESSSKKQCLEGSAKTYAATSQEAVETSARAVLSAIRAARTAQMESIGRSDPVLSDDDDSDDGLGIASVACSSTEDDAQTVIRETPRPPKPWRTVHMRWHLQSQVLLRFLQRSCNLLQKAGGGVGAGKGGPCALSCSRATRYMFVIALSSFLLRLVFHAAWRRRK